MDDLIERYIVEKEKLSTLEKRVEIIRNKILDEMEKENKDKIIKDKYSIVRQKTLVKRMSKENCPVEIWNRYSKESFVVSLRVVQKKK